MVLLLGLPRLAAAGPTAARAGGAWLEVGGGSASAGGVSGNATASEYVRVALAAAGRPVLAWHDRGLKDVLVAGWNGAGWDLLGAGAASPGGADDLLSCYPALAVLSGAPVVAWVQESSVLNFALYAKRWDGSAWVPIGTGSASGGGVNQTSGWPLYPSLAAVPGGKLVLAWQENSATDDEICVRQWSGSSWDEMGAGSGSGVGISHSLGRATHPAVAAGADGRVAVAWLDDASGAYEVYLRLWDGTAWTVVGTHSASGGGISSSHGGISGQEPPVVSLAADGRILVAWADAASGNAEIYLRCWDGSDWGPLGTGSATGGGVSATPGASTHPALVLTPAGTPLLAWQDQTGGPAQILARYWDGSSWVDAGGGGVGIGISQTAGASQRPALALDPVALRAFAAWDCSNGASNTEAYIRQWDGSILDRAPPQLWTLTLAGASPQALDFGFGDGSSEGLDDLDQQTVPGGGTAWFEIPGATLRRDVRPPASSATWRLVVAAGASDLSLRWPALASGMLGRYLSIYALTDNGLPLGNSARDLASAGAFAIPAGKTHTYVICYAADLVIDLALQAGWNALSLPLEPVDGRVGALTPLVPPLLVGPGRDEPAAAALGHGVAWTLTSAGSQPVTELHALTGYWLYAPAAAVLLLHGLPLAHPAWELHAGWNLVGPPADMAFPAHAALTLPGWRWDAGSRVYRQTTDLRRTAAFWLYAAAPATVSLENGRGVP